MNNNITKQEYTLSASTFEEAMKIATIISKTDFCPKQFQGRPESVLIAIQYGQELGLKPLQAIQNIGVINGKPSLYGDGMLAVVKSHPDYEWIKEDFADNEIYFQAICTIKRKGEPEVVSRFSQEDAKKAGLWGKAGPWSSYPKRMLQMRARGFAIRDAFPDALKGLISAEEARDYPEKDVTPKKEYKARLRGATTDVVIMDDYSPSLNTLETVAKEIDVEELATDKKVYNPSVRDVSQYKEVASPEKVGELMALFITCEVPQETIDRGCAKKGVGSVEELSPAHVDQWIEHLKSKNSDSISKEELINADVDM